MRTPSEARVRAAHLQERLVAALPGETPYTRSVQAAAAREAVWVDAGALEALLDKVEAAQETAQFLHEKFRQGADFEVASA